MVFSADNPPSTVSHGQTVVYRSTHLNQGGGYDASTGEFTCRLPGLYVFTVHAQTGGSRSADLYLHHNSGGVGRLYADGDSSSDRQSASTSAVLLLHQGDTVRVAAGGDSYLYSSGCTHVLTMLQSSAIDVLAQSSAKVI